MRAVTPGVRHLVATALFAALLTALLGAGYRLAGPGAGCYTLEVASSDEKSAMLQDFEKQFNPTHPADAAGRCFTVDVRKVNSGDAEAALEAGWKGQSAPRPDVWSPASTAWVLLLEERSPAGRALIPAGDPPKLFYSPLVIGMPQPMASALGYPARPVGWSTVLALARDPRGWAAVPGAAPAWGAFRLGKTNPTISTSGLHALIAAFFATGGDLTEAHVKDPAVQAFIGGIESGVVHYGDTASHFLKDLYDADNSGQGLTYISAIAVEEKELYDYDQGIIAGESTPLAPPHIPLVAVYPSEGTLMADHPWVLLNGSPHRDAAGRFLAWIESTQRAAVLAHNFRDTLHTAGADLAASSHVSLVQPARVITPPGGRVLQAMLDAWVKLRKRARVLIVVDAAGSSDAQLTWARTPLLQAVAHFDQGDQFGVWAYPAPSGSGAPYVDVRPIGGGPLETTLRSLHASPGKRDLAAVLAAAVGQVAAGYDGSRINAVLLVTDSVDGSRQPELERVLRNQPADRFVRVFVVQKTGAPRASQRAFAEVASAGRGAYYNPETADKFEADLVSNF